ncbi:MAG: hypothetical protein Q9223_007218, partial [Gallowayella weberi]
MDAGN